MDRRTDPAGADISFTEPTTRCGIKYLDVADYVRREIQSGRLRPNQYLTVAEVAAAGQVSPGTASHALAILHAEGYLARTDWRHGYRVAESKNLPVARPGKADAVCRHCGKAADEPGTMPGFVWLPPIRVYADTREALQGQADARNSLLADYVAQTLTGRSIHPSVGIPTAIQRALEEMASASGRTMKAEILHALERHTLRPATTEPNA
jgi:DNA-binding transcriptional MocR family regulator